jgi:RNA polymerase-binding transcription factor DksA
MSYQSVGEGIAECICSAVFRIEEHMNVDGFEIAGPRQPSNKLRIEETVRFMLINPDAHEVFVVGSFNNWNPCETPMVDLGHGRFVRDLNLPLGRYEYQFVLDGRWIHDRTTTESVINPFGGINSVVDVARRPVRVEELQGLTKQIKSEWRWHYGVLIALRERLVAEQIERLKEASEALEPHSMSLADSATDEFDHDLSLSDLSAKRDALYEVDQALRRIVDGCYGICEVTGKPIPPARLRAVPWTRFSKEVEAELERNGVLSRARLGEIRSVRTPFTSEHEVNDEENDENNGNAPQTTTDPLSRPASAWLHRSRAS